jgi:hypothetical protein
VAWSRIEGSVVAIDARLTTFSSTVACWLAHASCKLPTPSSRHEAQGVMALRVMRMAARSPGSQTEARRMVTEKVAALAEASLLPPLMTAVAAADCEPSRAVCSDNAHQAFHACVGFDICKSLHPAGIRGTATATACSPASGPALAGAMESTSTKRLQISQSRLCHHVSD